MKVPDGKWEVRTGGHALHRSSSPLRRRSGNCEKNALKTLAAICNEGQSEAARVSAACALLDRGFGKPTQQLETGSPGEFSRLTDEELEALIAEGVKLIATDKANGRATRS